jgi:2-polyprenyl-3-methyl-5-hydroxy-6-metoxy-1,4-benzoquinol methylase
MNVEEIKLLERIERDALITKFGDYETWYRSVGHAYLRQLELFYLKRFVDLSGQEIVVDAGCADGRIAIELAKQAQKIYAIDHSPKSIKVLNDRLEQHPELAKKIEPLVGDISNALFAQESIDRIISIQVLQHVPTESERLNTLSAFYGYLRPRGKLLLT